MEDHNAELIAAAVRSVALANALSWASVAMLLEEKGVLPRDKFADLAMGVARFLNHNAPADDTGVGADMLREVHDILRRQNPPKWTPTVIGGDAA